MKRKPSPSSNTTPYKKPKTVTRQNASVQNDHPELVSLGWMLGQNCRIRTSKSANNPNRDYLCGMEGTYYCWMDELRSPEIILGEDIPAAFLKMGYNQDEDRVWISTKAGDNNNRRFVGAVADKKFYCWLDEPRQKPVEKEVNTSEILGSIHHKLDGLVHIYEKLEALEMLIQGNPPSVNNPFQ